MGQRMWICQRYNNEEKQRLGISCPLCYAGWRLSAKWLGQKNRQMLLVAACNNIITQEHSFPFLGLEQRLFQEKSVMTTRCRPLRIQAGLKCFLQLISFSKRAELCRPSQVIDDSFSKPNLGWCFFTVNGSLVNLLTKVTIVFNLGFFAVFVWFWIGFKRFQAENIWWYATALDKRAIALSGGFGGMLRNLTLAAPIISRETRLRWLGFLTLRWIHDVTVYWERGLSWQF